jgi:hypothetical protein
MRNIFNRQNTSIGALAVLAVAGASVSAIAQGSLVGQTRCVKQSTAIFTDRSATSAVVRALATNQSVTLSENASQNGFIGVSAPSPGFVQTVNLRACAGAPSPTPTPTPTTVPGPASLCRRVIQQQGLLVRQSPNGGSALVGGAAFNSQVFLTTNPATTRTDADGRIWVQINKPLSGWVSNGYKDARGSNLVNCQ